MNSRAALRRLRVGRHRGAVGGDLLQRRRQRTDDGHSFDGEQFADLLDGDIGLAAAQEFGRAAFGLQLGLGVHFVGDAERGEHDLVEIPAAGTARRVDIRYGARIEQRAL